MAIQCCTGQDWWEVLFASSVHFILFTSHSVMSRVRGTLNPKPFKNAYGCHLCSVIGVCSGQLLHVYHTQSEVILKN